jgi:prophage regulatory protein
LSELLTTATDERSPPTRDAAALLDVEQVAALLHCSPRHVYRLSDAGRMPPPVRLGVLVRWSRQALDSWIASGCKPVRQQGRA